MICINYKSILVHYSACAHITQCHNAVCVDQLVSAKTSATHCVLFLRISGFVQRQRLFFTAAYLDFQSSYQISCSGKVPWTQMSSRVIPGSLSASGGRFG
jgi:hypothetical protein